MPVADLRSQSPKVVNSQTLVTLRGGMGSYLWARATSPPSALRGLLTMRSDSYIMFCICHFSNATQFLCNGSASTTICYHFVTLVNDLRSQSPTVNREKVKSKSHQNLRRLKLHYVVYSKGTPLARKVSVMFGCEKSQLVTVGDFQNSCTTGTTLLHRQTGPPAIAEKP